MRNVCRGDPKALREVRGRKEMNLLSRISSEMSPLPPALAHVHGPGKKGAGNSQNLDSQRESDGIDHEQHQREEIRDTPENVETTSCLCWTDAAPHSPSPAPVWNDSHGSE